VRSYVGLSAAHKRGYPRLLGQLAGDGCPCYHFSKFGRAALSMTSAPMLGVSLLGPFGLRVTQAGLSLLMAIPKTSCVCGRTVYGTGWGTAFKWCMLPYGRVPGAREFLFGVAGQ
jgi:hypothetical protein